MRPLRSATRCSPAEAGRLGAVVFALVLLAGGVAAGDEAAAVAAPPAGLAPQVAFEETVGGVLLRQYALAPMAQFSYLLASEGEAVVVDPVRDVDVYVQAAEALGSAIRAVVLTHTHTDFVAGHGALAARGAAVWVSDAMPISFDAERMADGAQRTLGRATLEFVATPGGHGTDGMTVFVHVPETAAKPLYALTGDVLLLEDVGRPERLAGWPSPMSQAEAAFDAVLRLDLLPDATRILPAHGGRPFRGRALGKRTAATLEQTREASPFLHIESRAAFVSRALQDLPPTARRAERIAALNRLGPPPRPAAPALPPALAPDAFAAATEDGLFVVDVRGPAAYAAGHVEGAVNLPLGGPFETFFDAVVPPGSPCALVGNEADVAEAAGRLPRIGEDQVRGYLAGGMDAWIAAGSPARTCLLLTPKDLQRRREAWIEPMLVDVSSPREYAARRLDDILNLPLGRLADAPLLLERSRPLLVVCKSGYRSAIAVGLLERLGFLHVGSLAGGLDAWAAEGLPLLPAAR